ncbi:tryptophan synthase alpha chain [Aequitasia blattaphilus]
MWQPLPDTEGWTFMSRIKNAFQNKKAFIPFITAGDPDIESTKEFILKMEEAGADLIEIGIPFSDPIAEGPVIQAADIRALASGTTTDKIFDMVEEVRETTQIPLAFMTYLNPVFHYGYDKFFQRCQEVKIDGVIIPDLPYEEKEEVRGVALKYQVEVISLIAPTSANRVKKIAKDAEGFLYTVSSMGVTGVRNEFNQGLKGMVEDVRKVSDIPVAIGFGISTPAQAKEMTEIADGVIVGSAIVNIVAKEGKNAGDSLFKYVKEMKDAIS